MFKRKLLSMVIVVGMLLGQTAPYAYAATNCDQAQFVSDITIPDGTAFAPGAAFTKTWRFSNSGTCTWTTSYNIVWTGGDTLGAPLTVKLPVEVPPGQMLDMSVNLSAPTTAGHYKALWKFSNATGAQFGIGDSASDPFWVDINVIATNAVIYDFVANAPYAKWKSGAGPLPYPGTSGDSRGFAYQLDKPHLEDDSFDSLPGLLTVPQNKYNGYIQATYPEFQVEKGDTLQTLVNCEFGATGCYVTFRIDYLYPNGLQRTLWTWKEAYDKRFYRANLDLSSLAGQHVRFVLMLLSSGYASGDRAIWGSPRIIRTGTTQPPAPPATLTPLPALTPTQTPITPPPPTLEPYGCDRATFVTDVNVPDGTIFAPGAAFSKTWRLKNSGTCTWTSAYNLTYYSGEQMSAPTSINLPWNVYSGQTVDLTINMVAPDSPGQYRGFWILTNASGSMFGIGPAASEPFWVEINVTGTSPIPVGYDFVANACSAQWKSGAGYLPCPGTDGDTKGFVLIQDTPVLEDGSTSGPGLITFPQYKYNGYIQGYYPTFTVKPGDRFQATVGCAYGSSCYVTYRLDYMNPNGYIGTFWTWREQNNGQSNNIDISLAPLAGRSVRFILTMLATGYASNDRAVWGSPRIFREGGVLPTVTPVPPTDTSTPTTDNWPTYTNSTYGFQFKYPPLSERFFETDNSVLIQMPITPGTNLREKYLQVTVRENIDPCQSPLAQNGLPNPPENVVINGITFLKQAAADAGAGNLHDWVGYSTLRGNACISMEFVLHSLNAGNYATPVPEFDKAAESAVFAQVMSTFAWLALPPTPTFTPVPPTDTAVPSTPTFTPTPGTTVDPSAIHSLSMIDSINGWATGQSYVLLTRDGGMAWQNAMPNISGNVTGSFFPNINTGWVITDVSDTSAGSLYYTTNGGLNWAHYDVPFNGGSIQFLDNNTGYVLQITGAAMNKQSVILYKTTDGGATWMTQYNNDPTVPGAANSLPLGGHKNGMTFRGATTGWVGGDIPTNGFIYLYKTTDSGVTWSPQALTIPTGYENAYMTTTAPKFFDANNGILPVWMGLDVGKRDLFIYSTHDGGTTWTISSGFARGGEFVSFPTLNGAFSWDWADVFHVTNNAGNTWTTFTPNVLFSTLAYQILDMDFTSTTTGWFLIGDGNGSSSLYRTSDGGHVWTLLFGNVPAPQLLPDLTITDIHIELQNTSCLVSDDALGVRLWVTNTGQASAGSFVVSVNGTQQTVNGLGVGETTEVFFAGYSNPVTAVVDATGLVAESDENNNSLSQMVAIPTPPLPCATPTNTPAPISLIGPYAVVAVAPNDVLNIRSGAGISNPVVGSFPPDTTNIMRTGPATSADNATWAEVQNPGGGTGWVNSSYLTEYVSHDAFCADTRIAPLIAQLQGSVNQSNGDMFSALVSPTHGVDVRLWAYAEAVNFTTTAAKTVFTSMDAYNWGGGPSGTPTVGSFQDIIQPKLLAVLNAPNVETYCDNLTKVYPLATPWPYPNIRYYNLYEPATRAEFDFRTWLIGFEYINNQPYISAMVTIIWEP